MDNTAGEVRATNTALDFGPILSEPSSTVIYNGPTRTRITSDDNRHICEQCHKRPAIKTDSEGVPKCAHCAAGLPDPIHNTGPKIGRNEPCPCGSLKKYKKCCLNKLQEVSV